ncbi:MAG: RNA-binding protein [Paludibaculum sp.]
MRLPQTLGSWKAAGPVRVEPKGIFNYMDGAGELYLGYRFKFLDVQEYKSPSEDDIIVELYWMETSDDAWGLLSGDWGGESVELDAGSKALYGAGLLRLSSGSLYARVMSYRETDASRQAVLALGKAIVAGREPTRPPRLVEVIPRTVDGGFSMRADRTVFLRSHLVLNNVYFLAQDNLLDLGLGCEMVATVYRHQTAKPVRLLFVRYASIDAAQKALAHFERVYLRGKTIPPGNRGSVKIEDGWVGFIVSGQSLRTRLRGS